MIEISLTTALALYCGVLLAGGIAIWIYTEVRTQYQYRALEKQHLWHCVFCRYTYLDEAADIISECPRCGSLNAYDDKQARFIRPSEGQIRRATAKTADLPAPRRNPSRRKRPGARRRGPRRR